MKIALALVLFFASIVTLGLVDTATGEVVVAEDTEFKCPIQSLDQVTTQSGTITRSMKFVCGDVLVDSHADLWYGDMVGVMQFELSTMHVGDYLKCNPARFVTGLFKYRGEIVYQCKPPRR